MIWIPKSNSFTMPNRQKSKPKMTPPFLMLPHSVTMRKTIGGYGFKNSPDRFHLPTILSLLHKPVQIISRIQDVFSNSSLSYIWWFCAEVWRVVIITGDFCLYRPKKLTHWPHRIGYLVMNQFIYTKLCKSRSLRASKSTFSQSTKKASVVSIGLNNHRSSCYSLWASIFY